MHPSARVLVEGLRQDEPTRVRAFASQHRTHAHATQLARPACFVQQRARSDRPHGRLMGSSRVIFCRYAWSFAYWKKPVKHLRWANATFEEGPFISNIPGPNVRAMHSTCACFASPQAPKRSATSVSRSTIASAMRDCCCGDCRRRPRSRRAQFHSFSDQACIAVKIITDRQAPRSRFPCPHHAGVPVSAFDVLSVQTTRGQQRVHLI